jgi:molecular chaperone IbpA
MNNVVPWKTNLHYPGIKKVGIGFEEMFSSLHHIASQSSGTPSKYPPYNLSRKGDQHTISVALAGFTKDEITVTKKDRTLTISGKKAASVEDPKEEIWHRGIAKRDFSLDFALATYVDVIKADMRDGILSVILQQDIPEEKKPQIIAIEG